MLKSKSATAVFAVANKEQASGQHLNANKTTSTSPQSSSSTTSTELSGRCESPELRRTCHSSSLTSESTIGEQSSRLITIYSNQHQHKFHERRKNKCGDQLSNQCSSANMHQHYLQPAPCDCYRQISAAICRRHKSNMSQGSCSSSSKVFSSPTSSSTSFGTWRHWEHLQQGRHHFPQVHSFLFVLCLTLLLHCSQAISRSENASLSSSSPSFLSSLPSFSSSSSTSSLSSSSPLSSSSAFSGRSSGNGLEFDPRVSAKCERNLMHISVSAEQPFNGIVHVRNYRRNPCQTYGNGSLITTLTIDLLAASNKPNYCGVHRVKGSEERSISLVVRLHRALELSDDKHFVITCGNTEFYNKNKNEKLMFKFVDAAGHRVSKLYHGEPYRLRAEIVSSSQDSSSSHLASASFAGGGSPPITTSTTSSYHLYIRNCFIFAGNESDVEFIDANGCPSLSSVLAFRQIGENIAEAEISSMFKLHNTNQVHVQCMVELVANCRFCESTLCPALAAGNDTRKAKMKTVPALQPADMQMLASTTAYVFEPDNQMSHASIQAANGLANGTCSEWRFPWLIALCIMLGVLLIIMLTVNIFLCTSMSCSCFKQEIVEREPTIIEDYDPYKIDVGFYSPYDSRLSLNRNYQPTIGMGGSFASGNDSGEHFFSSTNQQHNQHHRQQSPATATSGGTGSQQTTNGVVVHHNRDQHHGQAVNHQPQHMLLTSYSPVENSLVSNRPTVAAVRQVANPAPGRQITGGHHISSRHNRQQVPSGGQTSKAHFEAHSPRSIRSQEYY